ncbi:Protein SPA1-related 3 [Vitis vinifera]|uniref:Protein SPA1-related 3 n=1 Tax=Vitis vinifera TaxID=29760 RepID=A0A438H458_VITVI|nr:Protein SPA1-related 3 [Vitis vinifera]
MLSLGYGTALFSLLSSLLLLYVCMAGHRAGGDSYFFLFYPLRTIHREFFDGGAGLWVPLKCVFDTKCYRWMTMEGSSESGWRNSDISRGLNVSIVSHGRNPRQRHANRIGLSGGASHDSGFISGRKERDHVLSSHAKNHKNQVGISQVCDDDVALDPFVRAIEWGDVSLRHWLDKPERRVDALECLHIFTQIAEIVNAAHSQGVVVNNVRPSCFVMSSFNHVSFIESVSCSDSGSDSLEDGSNSHTEEDNGLSSLPDDLHLQKSVSATHVTLVEDREEYKSTDRRSVEQSEEKKQTFPMKEILLMETNWYTSPEEISGAQTSCASDIYQLGVLLFELKRRKEQNYVLFEASSSSSSVVVEVAKGSFILPMVAAP